MPYALRPSVARVTGIGFCHQLRGQHVRALVLTNGFFFRCHGPRPSAVWACCHPAYMTNATSNALWACQSQNQRDIRRCPAPNAYASRSILTWRSVSHCIHERNAALHTHSLHAIECRPRPPCVAQANRSFNSESTTILLHNLSVNRDTPEVAGARPVS